MPPLSHRTYRPLKTEHDHGYSAAAGEALISLWPFPEQRRGVAVALAYGALFHCDHVAPSSADRELVELLFAAYDAAPDVWS